MPNEKELIRAHLGRLGLAPGREEEIVRELGEHLEDHAAALEASSTGRDSALRQALDSVPDWGEFRDQILAAETPEEYMNYRTKALWLPALGALTLSNVLLAVFQIFGPPARFHWFHVGKDLQTFCAFVIPWLISQPVVGALAAYWSRRAGGTVRHQLLAALAPAIALLGVFVLILPFAMIVDRHVTHTVQVKGILVLTATWVLLPGLPLLLGAAPFLRRPLPQS